MNIEVIKRALEALEGFIAITNDSQGVNGYHLNGDIAEWNEFDEVDKATEAIAALRTAIEQAEKQEPVAWMVYTLDGKSVCVTDNPQDFSDKNRVFPLYTDPPAIEAKLKEKNK
jgi:hypothetical protein